MFSTRAAGFRWADRRRDVRHEVPPIAIELEQVRYETRNWSLGGFRIGGYEGAAVEGQPITASVLVSAGGRDFRHEIEAVVIRRDYMGGDLAAAYTGLAPEAVDTLEGLITGRLRRRGG